MIPIGSSIKSPVRSILSSPVGDAPDVATPVLPTTNLIANHDASKEVFNFNDPVGTFTDQFGSFDLTQTTGAKKPTMKTNKIFWDGVDDLMSYAGEIVDLRNDFCIHVLADDLSDTPSTMYSQGGTGSFPFALFGENLSQIHWVNPAFTAGTDSQTLGTSAIWTVSGTTPIVVTFQNVSGSWTVRKNNVLVAQDIEPFTPDTTPVVTFNLSTLGALDRNAIAAASFREMYVYETAFYSGQSDADRAGTVVYLQAKGAAA